MLRDLRHRLTYQLERLLLGGSIYRLLVIAVAIGLISLTAGLLKFEWETVEGAQQTQDDGVAADIWWAFLRMTDPGYLGDDSGTVVVTIATVVTICGYVLFMGALIAIMTQWLNATIDRLEQGLTPIVRKRHVVVLGWTERTPEILRELVLSGTRLRRFLRRVGARRLVIAVLAEQVSHELMVGLRERLGKGFARSEIILRSGDPLRIEHLRRVDYARAGVIIIPGEEHVGAGEADVDAQTVKVLLTIGRFAAQDGARQMPSVVAALRDSRKVQVARSAYPKGDIGTLAVDAVIGRMLAQSLRHPGLTYVLDEVLTQTFGSELYLREFADLVGRPVHSLATTFADAVVLGVLRGHGATTTPLLNPGPDVVVEEGDRLVLLADDYEVHRRRDPPAPPAPSQPQVKPSAHNPRRLLVLGWNHLTPDMLFELDQHGEASEVVVMSTVAISARQRRLEQTDAVPNHLALTQLDGDCTVPKDLDEVDVASFDDVLILGTDRLSSPEDSDARTLLVQHLAREAVTAAGSKTRILVELHDPGNAALFDDDDTEVLASGEVVSHLLAQMALRLELGLVVDRLFGPGGQEIAFVPAADYGLTDGETVDFDRLIVLAAARGEIALGARIVSGVVLNPPRDRSYRLGVDDAVVVMRTVADGG